MLNLQDSMFAVSQGPEGEKDRMLENVRRAM
jgi:hypothetical protein